MDNSENDIQADYMTATALISSQRYCEMGIYVTEDGHPAGAGWNLLRDLDGMRQAMEKETSARIVDIDHRGHAHSKIKVMKEVDWHYWPSRNGIWMGEHLATGEVMPIKEWIDQQDTESETEQQ